jgi:hypothetical protein
MSDKEEEKPVADAEVEADEVDDAPAEAEAEPAPEAPKEPLTINEGVQVGLLHCCAAPLPMPGMQMRLRMDAISSHTLH